MSTDSAATHAGWNTEARSEAVAEFGSLTMKQIDEQHPIGTAGRWLAEARVFAVEGREGSVLPAFQLLAGEPLPVSQEFSLRSRASCAGGRSSCGSPHPMATWTVLDPSI